MKNILKGKFRKSAFITLCASLLCCLTIAGVGLISPAHAMNTAGAVSVGELYSGNKFDAANVKSLYQKFGVSTYDALQSQIKTAPLTSSDIAAKNGNKDLVVTFGGKKWTVTYVSEDLTGNIIATLWYADTEATDIKFSENGWINKTDDGKNGATHSKYSNLYGASYARTYGLNNAGKYYSCETGGEKTSAEVDSTVSLKSYTQDASHTFAKFTMSNVEGSVVPYLVSPENVGWQADEGVNSVLGYRLPSESYKIIETTSANGWGVNFQNTNFQNQSEYTAWAKDTLWLPSLTETGNQTDAGLWNLSANQRTSGALSRSWLRSGSPNGADRAVALDTSGNNGNYGVSSSGSVRPALHLNLTKVAASINSGTDDIFNSDTNNFNTKNLTALYKKLGAADYTSLTTNVQGGNLSASDIAKLNDNQGDVTVTFGGFDWTVTYLSTTKTGEVIATLWYKDFENGANFSNGWRSAATDGGTAGYIKHSNHYGGSSLRAITLGNGGKYYTASGLEVQADTAVTEKTATTAEMQSSKFYNFAKGNLSAYLDTPNNVDWQTKQYTSSVTYRYANENLVEVTDNWYNANIQNSQSYPLYYNWGNDKVWLPSISETGNGINFLGIWQTSQAQRKSTFSETGASGNGSWLRSGIVSSPYGAHVLDTEGKDYNMRSTNNLLGVRPAIHLNLTKAAQAVSDNYFVDTNKNLIDKWNAAVEESVFNGGKQVTFTLTENWYALPDSAYTTSFGSGIGFSNGQLAVTGGANIVLDLNGHTLDRSLTSQIASGAVLYVDAATLHIKDSSPEAVGTITGGRNVGSGGAISATSAARIILDGGNIVHNVSDSHGGGININNSYLEMNGGVVGYNTANTNGLGGGIFIGNGSMVFNGGIVRNNTSLRNGGGIYVNQYGEITVNGGEVFSNSTPNNGGGISGNGKFLTINNVKIYDNYAGQNGGGIYTGNGVFTLNGGEISDNRAAVAGAGINVVSGKVVLNDGLISANRTEEGTETQCSGAGIYLHGNSTLDMYGGSITLNYAKRWGGGVYINSGSVFNMYGGQFIGNESVRGGGVYLNDGTFNLYDGYFTGNSADSATDSGSAIYVRARAFNMYGGVVTKNIANGNGAVYVGGPDIMTLYGGVIINNTTANVSGAGFAPNLGLVHSTSATITIGGDLSKVPTKIGVGYTSSILRVFTKNYTSAGNLTTDRGYYFFADVSGQAISVSGNELQIITGTQGSMSNFMWKYTHNGTATNIPVDTLYLELEYTGNPYIIGLASGTIEQAIDSNGRPVSALVNVGTYKFKAANSNGYKNPVLTVVITPQSLSGATVTVNDAGLVYNGKPHTPEVTVVWNGTTLIKDKDYTLTYSNNVNAGNATVTVEGKGNLKGVINKNFYIEKRNVEIRWGDITKTYNGAVQGITAYVEGVLQGESVGVNVFYEKNGKSVSPINAGTYTAHAVLSASANYKLAPNAQTFETFTITPKTVTAVWSGLNAVYDGTAQTPTAYYTDISGKKINLAVSVSGSHTGANTYTATAALNDTNYALSASSVNAQFTISKKGLELIWGTAVKVYDGNPVSITKTLTDLDGNDLTGLLTFEYFDKDGKSLGTAAPANVGKYKVRATLTHNDYSLAENGGKLIDYSECEIEITAADAVITWTFANDTFSGSGKAPAFTFDNPADAVTYAITYAADDGSGNPVGEFTTDLPVNAGKYIAKVEFDNGNYEEILYQFTIQKMNVAVTWSGDSLSVMQGASSYKWLYDGSEHAPKAVASVSGVTVDGTAVTSLEITVAGQKNVGNHTATAVLKNTELNKNFALTNDTQSYIIERSEITSLEWYEYGSATPLASGVKPSYQYISVYGRQGPKLSAYGIAKMQGPDASGATVTITVKVPLNVTYSGNINASGYWSVGTYTAVAALSSDAAANSTLTATALTLDFDVTELQLETSEADVEWVFDGNALTDSGTNAKYWIYDGQPHAPEARRIPDRAAYNPANPATYDVLPVGGAMTDAGVYYAYILPCNYEIDDADADCMFEIRPREITVQWSGVNGGTSAADFEYTYNGLAQGPSVTVTGGTNGLQCNLKPVIKYVDAGSYTAYAEADSGNFVILNGASQNFTVKKMTINPNDVVWAGVNGGTSANDFKFAADGNPHAPTATLELTINGAQVTITLKVTGATAAVGTHKAYATLDSSDIRNANFTLSGAEKIFTVEESAIRAIMWEDENADGNIEFVYDGTTSFCPKAYYWDSDNNKVYLNVIGGRTEAGEYIAYITDNTGLTAGMTHKFTVKPMELNVSWTDTAVTYNSAERRPVCSFTDADGATVTLTLGSDYTVSGFTTAGTYTAEITFINKNFTFVSGTENTTFTINPKKVTITWTANTDGSFNYEYNGKAQRPAFTSDDANVTITVVGAETNVGTYVAVASVDDNNYYLSDGTHSDKAEREFSIVPFKIRVEWRGEDGDLADFSWEYDGQPHAPEAYFVDWSGDAANPVQLSVRGEKTDAGTGYVAVAIAPENCEFKYSGTHANSGSRSFEITPKVITGIVWKGENGSLTDFTWEYDGTVKTPVAETAEGDTLAVTGSATDAGVYTATAVLTGGGNYMFDSSLDPTKQFTIDEKTVAVIWYGNNGGTSASDFVYDYTGSLVCPTAKFEDVGGNLVDVPVNGGASAAGQNHAEAVDVFANYKFDTATQTQPFTIKEKSLVITWSDGDKLTDGKYTYEFNGKAQMPLASTADGENLSYVIKNSDGTTVNAAIAAGEYTITVSPVSSDYVIASDNTVTVVITPKTVAVQWGSLTLDYTGEAIAPKAWFIDANNQAVELEVSSAQTEAGTNYSVTADFKKATANYVLDSSTVNNTFDIVKNTEQTLVWDWATGSWITPSAPEPEPEPEPETTQA